MSHLHPGGLILICCSIYLTLMAYRIIPTHPKDPEKMELWHRKFGKLMKIIGPLLILNGLLELFGVL